MQLSFHRCLVCGVLFYHGQRTCYCAKCVPSSANPVLWQKNIYKAINNAEKLQERRARDRARWHIRMSNPAFREKERLRGLKRARAKRKYAKEENENEKTVTKMG